MIGYIDERLQQESSTETPVKVSVSSLSSMILPLWLREGIEESQGTTQKETQEPGGGPSIRDAIDDGESKKDEEIEDFKSSRNRSLRSRYDWGGMLEV